MTDPIAYMYQGNLYCPDCVIYEIGLMSEKDPTETVLNRLALFMKIDRKHEHTFDSNLFPKIAFECWIRAEDPCHRCEEPLKTQTKRQIELAEMGIT